MESLIVDWLNENQSRAYPLSTDSSRVTTGSYTLSDEVIVDAQLTYSAPQSTVYLTSIVTTSSTVTINITGKTFAVDLTQSFPQYIRISDGSLLVVSDAILDIPSGYTYAFSNCYFENSVVYEYSGAWLGVTSLTVGTHTLVNTVNLEDGIQVSTSTSGSTISLYANRDGGTPLDCTAYGGGSSDCTSIVSYINGVGPDVNNLFTLTAGPNVVLMEDPDNHRIFVGLTFTTNDICPVIYPNTNMN